MSFDNFCIYIFSKELSSNVLLACWRKCPAVAVQIAGIMTNCMWLSSMISKDSLSDLPQQFPPFLNLSSRGTEGCHPYSLYPLQHVQLAWLWYIWRAGRCGAHTKNDFWAFLLEVQTGSWEEKTSWSSSRWSHHPMHAHFSWQIHVAVGPEITESSYIQTSSDILLV